MFTIDEDNVMTLTKGDTASFTVAFTNPNGTPYIPTENDVITFGIKRWITARVYVLTKTAVNSVVTILPADTKSLNSGIYRYDIQIKLATGEITTIIENSPFVLRGEIVESE